MSKSDNERNQRPAGGIRIDHIRGQELAVAKRILTRGENGMFLFTNPNDSGREERLAILRQHLGRPLTTSLVKAQQNNALPLSSEETPQIGAIILERAIGFVGLSRLTAESSTIYDIPGIDSPAIAGNLRDRLLQLRESEEFPAIDYFAQPPGV